MFNKFINGVRGVLKKMGLIKDIKSVKDHKKVNITDEAYEEISMYKQLYSGHYPEWHDTVIHVIGGNIPHKVLSLGMPKITAHKAAQLVFNEKCTINIDNEEAKKYVDEVLKKNDFYKNFRRYDEYKYAMGFIAAKVYFADSGVRIAWTKADSFFPLSSDSENVDEGLFVNTFKKGDYHYSLLEWNEWGETYTDEMGVKHSTYVIKNELYKSDKEDVLGSLVSLTELYPDLAETTTYADLTRSTFVFTKTATANNKHMDSPLGIPLFANALDTIKAIDEAFDSFNREFRLGKKRIMVPDSMVQGKPNPYTGRVDLEFDTNDEVYQKYKSSGVKDETSIVDISVDIRAEAHIKSINSLLNVYAMQIGFSPGTFTFDGNSVKTATEVISEKSETYQLKSDNSNLVEDFIKDLVQTIVEVGAAYDDYSGTLEFDCTVDFDDSIIQDRNADLSFYLLANGAKPMMPLEESIKRMFKLTDNQAKEWARLISNENAGEYNPEELLGSDEGVIA